MSSRETILSAVKANQPEKVILPDTTHFETHIKGSAEKFAAVLSSIGGKIFYVSSYAEITRLILAQFDAGVKIVSTLTELTTFANENIENISLAHELSDVGVAILKAHFGVAENGAVWVTLNNNQHRALPFICQHLAVIIDSNAIVPTMHEAYELIGKTTYGFGTFIAGPSKTADIEQSLVIGAHGARSMTVFLINKSAAI